MLKMRNRTWCKKNSHVCHKFQFLREHQEKNKIPLPPAKSCHKSYILELSWGTGKQNPISGSGECSLWQQLQHNRNLVSGEVITASKPSKPFSSELKLLLPFLPHAPDVQDIWKQQLPLRLLSNTDSIGKTWNASVYLAFLHQNLKERRQHSQEVLAELCFLTWMFFFSMTNSLIFFWDLT